MSEGITLVMNKCEKEQKKKSEKVPKIKKIKRRKKEKRKKENKPDFKNSGKQIIQMIVPFVFFCMIK